MRWSVTTAPTGTVLTWEQLKHHIIPGSVAQQPYIMGDLLPSAITYAETKMQCALLPQTITAIYDQSDIGWNWGFYAYNNLNENRAGLELPRGPVITIASVTDANSNPVTYQRRTYGNGEYILPTQSISFEMQPITVVYQAGFATVPADIVNAIRVHVATMYLVREDITNLAANPVHKIDAFYEFRGRGCMVG